jgi:hypothetical protein
MSETSSIKIDSHALERMNMAPRLSWAAYQSPTGHLKFLATGPKTPYPTKPPAFPDGLDGEHDNSAYKFIGWVNLKHGAINICSPSQA